MPQAIYRIKKEYKARFENNFSPSSLKVDYILRPTGFFDDTFSWGTWVTVEATEDGSTSGGATRAFKRWVDGNGTVLSTDKEAFLRVAPANINDVAQYTAQFENRYSLNLSNSFTGVSYAGRMKVGLAPFWWTVS